MAKRAATTSTTLDFAFFHFLWQFHQANRGTIRSHYKELTRKFLDFNNPEKNPKAFLRQPQFEALEVYIFLKEFLGNAKVEEVFQAWFEKKGRFAGRAEGGVVSDRAGQVGLFDKVTQDQYRAVFAAMRKNSRVYPNYIFALTMGTGKTILMATCIFYEFLLGNKFEKDTRYCHNALVFAPDKTVLQSLKEIESFDLTGVVPPEYVNFLTMHLRFHYLEEAGTSLDTLDRSRFNIIVSNTQKIILKRQRKEKSATDLLFGSTWNTLATSDTYASAADLYGFDQPEEEGELTTNQRFEKLCRLEQLGIFVDEAHHAFGKALAKDMGLGAKETDTSLRTTIDILSASLRKAGTRVVACYNYTGTPYVGREVLPEVVYAYGLKEAIDKSLLKKVQINSYKNARTTEFVDISIGHFLESTRDLQPEGLSPKMAFFAGTIEELQTELRPAVERALRKRGIPVSRILVNVGDEKLTTNDDIREFNRLDTPGSDKQFILLVNKGREGWNCRSLFSVALFREPKSRIFVLQATMRCLRSIGTAQHTAQVFLSEENLGILREELDQNFRITVEELHQAASDRERVRIHVGTPPVKIKLVRVRRTHELKEKADTAPLGFDLDRNDAENWNRKVEKYRLLQTSQEGLPGIETGIRSGAETTDLTHLRVKRVYSRLTLVAEVSRYLNINPVRIDQLLEAAREGMDGLLSAVNEYNELLYDELIPRLFNHLFELDGTEEREEYEVELVKIPTDGYYEVSARKDLIVRSSDHGVTTYGDKSFHLDTYCFDSTPERTMFFDLLKQGRVKKLYFTGMLTHGQSDFFVQYIDPETHQVRTYYPDFLFLREDPDGSEKYVIVEVKADNQIDDAVVQAKKSFAERMAIANGMEYELIKASDAEKHNFLGVLGGSSNVTPTIV